MIAPENYNPEKTHQGYPIYDKNANEIVWHCGKKSECSKLPPAESGIPEYYFLLKFSNSEVDSRTNCKFEVQFVVRVFGYKIGQQQYSVLAGTLLVLFAHVIGYYFWKTRFYWLAKLHREENLAIKKLLSFGNLAFIYITASQASLKNNLLEAIYNDDTYLLSEVLAKTENTNKRASAAKKSFPSKNKLADDLKRLLEKQIADHDIRGIGITVGELARHNIFKEEGEHNPNSVLMKAKKILAKKANIVLHLIDAMECHNYKELADALAQYKDIMPSESVDNNSLLRQATAQLSSVLTKQLLKSLKKKDTWEIHYAIKEFKAHGIPDRLTLIPKAEQVIYGRLTNKLKKAIKQGTPQLLRDAITDTEKDLEFHKIPDTDAMIHQAKNLLYKILKDKLSEELRKRDSVKIRNAINRFAYYGVTDASGFLDKANRNLYNLVIPPIAKTLEHAKTPEDIYQVVNRLRSELNKFGLQDKEKIVIKTEKMLYNMVAKQLQAAIKSKSRPKTLSVILAAFIMSKKQYNITDHRRLEEAGKTLLYQQLVPFLLKILAQSEPDIKHLSAAIIAAKMEFSKLGLPDPGDVIEKAETKLYQVAFASLKEMISFSKDSKALWMKLKSTQTISRELNIVDKEYILAKAESRFTELCELEIEEAVQRKDLQALKSLAEFIRPLPEARIELIKMIEKQIKELSIKLSKMNTRLEHNMGEYNAMKEELRSATATLNATGNIQAIMPIITKFENSGFPDIDGAQKAALSAVTNLVDSQFRKHLLEENYGKVALLRDLVNASAMESKSKDTFYLLTVVCGRYLTAKSDIEMSVVEKSADVIKYIQMLEQATLSLKTLKTLLPEAYIPALNKLDVYIKALIEKAGELSAFLSSVEEIRSDLCDLNPVDIMAFEKYLVVPSRVIDILRAFFIVLGKPFTSTQTWTAVRQEISSYVHIMNLLKEAKSYVVGTVGMAEILEAKELSDPYLELINVTAESSNEHTTLAIILKWVLLTINETTTYYKELGAGMHEIVTEYTTRKKSRQMRLSSKEVRKDSVVHGKVINPTELAQTKALISACGSIVRPEWNSSYLSRWIKAYPAAELAVFHLHNSVILKDSLKLWRIFYRYAAKEPLFTYGTIIERSGTDSTGNPLYLCQLGSIDWEGLALCCSKSEFMLYAIYLLEKVEHECKQNGYSSMLIVDATKFHLPMQSSHVEGLSWFHSMITLMCRNYPGLFSTVFLVQGAHYDEVTEKLAISLFTEHNAMRCEFIEGDSWKDVISPLVSEDFLPPTLGGSYNIAHHLNSPAKIPATYYLPQKVQNKSRAHWTSLSVETMPRILIYQQPERSLGALLFVEFEPDGPIDFEIYYLPPGVTDILRKTSLVLVAQVDHYYSNHIDAVEPGKYHIAFSNNFSRSPRTVTYEAGIANTVEDVKEYIYKFDTDSEGNMTQLSSSNYSFLIA
ncbi:uncharacterized protein [Watersipora subatra]|uniref:uncharacterized protein n=1 Tax=Watersipora subatra TaxID=2589382 RepID=UPI00355C03B6